MEQGAKTLESVLSFLKEKVSIEEDYSRRMMSLSRKFQIKGVYETGSIRDSLEALKLETENLAKSHYNESRKIRSEIYEKTEAFLSDFRAKRKPIENLSENLLDTKKMVTKNALKLNQRYVSEVANLNALIAQESLSLGGELDKVRGKLYKQQQVVNEIKFEYKDTCLKLEELNKNWTQEWMNSSKALQDLEAERLQFLITTLWEYLNIISVACVNDDTSCESVRKYLQMCDIDNEIDIFSSTFQTGTEIFETPKFVEFGQTANQDGLNTKKFNLAPSSSSPSKPIAQNYPSNGIDQFPFQSSKEPSAFEQESLTAKKSNSPNIRVNQGPAVRRRPPPPSEDGQTSISNPSTNSMLHREGSSYSQPTSISSFADAVDPNLRSSQNWNSPTRRRSRNSDTVSVSTQNRRSFIINQERNRGASEYIDLTKDNGEDPLRATLEDLKIGGNGGLKPRPRSTVDILESSTSTLVIPENQATQRPEIRPKSMVFEGLNHSGEYYGTSSRSRGRISNDQSGLRSKSKSSVNLVAKLASDSQLPTVTSTGQRVIQYAKALYDFKKKIDIEVSFIKGDILLIVEKQPDSWWNCENVRTKEIGLAPYNYLDTNFTSV